jgi:hypothetical protein
MKPPVINADEFLKSMAAEAVKQREQIRTGLFAISRLRRYRCGN